MVTVDQIEKNNLKKREKKKNVDTFGSMGLKTILHKEPLVLREQTSVRPHGRLHQFSFSPGNAELWLREKKYEKTTKNEMKKKSHVPLKRRGL